MNVAPASLSTGRPTYLAGVPAEPLPDTRRTARAGDADQDAVRDTAELQQELEGLRRRLATQPSIEQAKGILVAFYGIEPETAFSVLARWSQHANTKLHLVAAAIVAAASKSSDQPYSGLRSFLEQLPAGRPGHAAPPPPAPAERASAADHSTAA